MKGTTILIVDDELSIRKTLEAVLVDEGFSVLLAADGDQALRILDEQSPTVAAVLLDIWMPGMDGLEVLSLLRKRYPTLPVIMISGHATIATAISATRLGAQDFIEKPLDLHATLAALHRVLRTSTEGGAESASAHEEAEMKFSPSEEEKRAFVGKDRESKVNPVVFSSQKQRGRAVQQKTIGTPVILYGQGLHSGKKSGLLLEPLPANSGIHFVGISETTPVPAFVDYVGSTGFATTVKLGTTEAGTIEHLMSALHAFGITNLLIKCNGEVPVMDGSALEFCKLLERAGIVNQPGEWYEIAVTKSIRIGDDREFIEITPAETFSVEYILNYPHPVGLQQCSYELSSPENYKQQIAPARTFGFVRDVGALQKQGLALGGRFDNFVLIGEHGPINGDLRFPDELVKHKILDAIGDLYLLGRPLRGKVRACMTGHSDNIALLRAIHEQGE